MKTLIPSYNLNSKAVLPTPIQEKIQSYPISSQVIQQPATKPIRQHQKIDPNPAFEPDNLNVNQIETYTLRNPVLRQLDLMFRNSMDNLENIGNSFGKTFEKSQALAMQYTERVKKADEMVTVLKQAKDSAWIPEWLRTLVQTWSVSSLAVVTLSFFLFKIWQLGMLPDFKSTAIKMVGHFITPAS